MTPLDCALRKAYARKPASASDTPRTGTAPPAVRGWVARLRTPAPQAARAPAAPPASVARDIQKTDVSVEDIENVEVVHRPEPAGVSATGRLDTVMPETILWRGPAICERLFESAAGPGLLELAAQIERTVLESPVRSVVFSGSRRAAGRTSLVAAVARRLLQRTTFRILLVDLDCGHPQLASLLDQSPQSGLWQAACQLATVDETLLRLVPERLALLPLCQPVAEEAMTPLHASAICDLLHQLRESYDVVLIDAGPWTSIPRALRAGRIADAGVWIRRAADAVDDDPESAARVAADLEILGLVETFAPQVAGAPPTGSMSNAKAA